jgi:hypothetical protein
MALAMTCRCWAMESATSFRAAILSSSLVRMVVARGGMSSSGFKGGVEGVEGVLTAEEEEEDMIEREEGGRVCRGGRYCEEYGVRRGVFALEFRVEVGRTRFARRKVKNAGF